MVSRLIWHFTIQPPAIERLICPPPPFQSKRKGMSLEDKRQAMLGIFVDSRDVFVLKDIEKMSVKKGIIQQSVKEVLQVCTLLPACRHYPYWHACHPPSTW